MVRVLIDSSDKLVECLEVQSQIKIMYECFLFVSDVHKSRIQGREQFLYLSEINIPYRIAVALNRLLVQFDQLVIFHQSQRYFCRIDIDDKIFYGLHRFLDFLKKQGRRAP